MADSAVIFDSRGGNTRKVADAMAEELGVTAGDARNSTSGNAKILFLGSGTYGGRSGEAMMKFIGSGTFTGNGTCCPGSPCP